MLSVLKVDTKLPEAEEKSESEKITIAPVVMGANPPSTNPAAPTPAPRPKATLSAPAATTSVADYSTRPISRWSADDVISWAKDKKLKFNFELLADEGVDGEGLLDISDKMLQDEFDVPKEFSRVKIIKAIKKEVSDIAAEEADEEHGVAGTAPPPAKRQTALKAKIQARRAAAEKVGAPENLTTVTKLPTTPFSVVKLLNSHMEALQVQDELCEAIKAGCCDPRKGGQRKQSYTKVKRLLEYGADPNVYFRQDDSDGNVKLNLPLCLAAGGTGSIETHHNLEIASLLLEHNADPNKSPFSVNSFRPTAMAVAVLSGHVGMVELLLKHDGDRLKTTTDVDGTSLSQCAVDSGFAGIAMLLRGQVVGSQQQMPQGNELSKDVSNLKDKIRFLLDRQPEAPLAIKEPQSKSKSKGKGNGKGCRDSSKRTTTLTCTAHAKVVPSAQSSPRNVSTVFGSAQTASVAASHREAQSRRNVSAFLKPRSNAPPVFTASAAAASFRRNQSSVVFG